MLFLGNNPAEIIIINRKNSRVCPGKMRYDSFGRDGGKKWNQWKAIFPDLQLAEEIIHTHFLDKIDEKLIKGILSEGDALKMVDIIVELRDELIKVAQCSYLPIPLWLKQSQSARLLQLLEGLQEMALD